jgi:hypothetical protein
MRCYAILNRLPLPGSKRGSIVSFAAIKLMEKAQARSTAESPQRPVKPGGFGPVSGRSASTIGHMCGVPSKEPNDWVIDKCNRHRWKSA